MRVTPIDRFASRLTPRPDGCILWTGGIAPSGHGKYLGTTAHRWIVGYLWGDVPTNIHIHHVCRTPACVNPDHLRALHHAEHGRSHQRLLPGTTCVNGHLMDEATAYRVPRKNRASEWACRRCNREAVRRYQARKALP